MASDGIQGLRAAGDVGLVSDHQQQESESFQTPQAAGGAFHDLQLRQRCRRVRLAVADDCPIQNPSRSRKTARGASSWPHRFPFRLRLLQGRMGDDQVPDNRLKGLRMGRRVHGVHGGTITQASATVAV